MLRKFLSFFIRLIIKALKVIPKNKVSKWIISSLTVLKNTIDPNLYIDKNFLTYVYKKKLGIENNINIIKTLALRGSNVDYGFYTPIWDYSYNIGLTSTDFYTSFKLYEKYQNKLCDLQNVIFFLNIPSIGYSLIKTAERYRAVSYKHFFGVPYQYPNEIKRKYENKVETECRNIIIEKLEPSYSGYEKKNAFIKNVSAKERARTHLRENQREPDQMEWIVKLIDLTRKKNLNLFFVIPPYRTDFKNVLPPKTILFKKIYKLNLKGAILFDYYDSTLFDDSDFGDMDHLNEKGAIKLTSELKNQLSIKGYI